MRSFVFDGSPDGNDGQSVARMKLPAKRYTPSQAIADGWTLLFTHATGSHKEQWEPVIQELMNYEVTVDSERSRSTVRPGEAWSLDWQSHGEGAIINEQYLKDRSEGVSATQWAVAIVHFIKSKNFNPRRTVAIGHSAGSTALMLATKHFPVDKPPFAALILVEPVMIPRQTYTINIQYMEKALAILIRNISGRRDVWQSREEALEWMMKRPPWKGWDPRVVRLYCEHGLRDMWSSGATSVTINCNKKHEASTFADVEDPFAAMVQFGVISKTIPTHFIFGERNDVVPKFQREAVLDPSHGGVIASIQIIPGAGHMVSQEKPESVARAVSIVLNGLKSGSVSPKL